MAVLKFDFSSPLTELDGSPMKSWRRDSNGSLAEDGYMLSGKTCAHYLLLETEGLLPVDKLERAELARLVYAGGIHAVTYEQVALLRKTIEKAPALIYAELVAMFSRPIVDPDEVIIQGEQDS